MRRRIANLTSDLVGRSRAKLKEGARLPLVVGCAAVLVVVGGLVAALAVTAGRFASAQSSSDCAGTARCSSSADDAQAGKVEAVKAVAPTVVSTSPAPGATAVASDATITVDFSIPLRATSSLLSSLLPWPALGRGRPRPWRSRPRRRSSPQSPTR